ncbi:Arylesterase [Polystyrenella longa]|uniref:Arylesterase n=1 Tax=Polystyrenella longa TaxID=2528007 RepID=A0A518CHV0_9PLAN|nr:alpha/beta fold hydrolase [Polystyrenella longa]QDU78808.1 Arylesterase [Polystyrenella longa]
MFPIFKPARLLRNPHLQTILPAFFTELLPAYAARQHRINLSDGDQVVLHDDEPEQWQDGDPIVLMTHGLTGSYLSSYLVRLSDKLNKMGFRTFRKDLRNCGAGFGLARFPYHAGRSQDLLESIEYIHQMAPNSPISLVGYSLSGNIVLRTLAEDPDSLPEHLVTAVAVNPPIDLHLSVQALDSILGRFYDRYFTKRLMKHIQLLSEHDPIHDQIKFDRIPQTVYELDDAYTAPMSGFDSAEHYYAETSSRQIMSQIRLPSLLLTANDDPLIPVRMFEGLDTHPAVTLHVAPHGGHLGYRGKRGGDPDHHWMDWRILEWLDKHGRPNPEKPSAVPAPHHHRRKTECHLQSDC